MNVMWVWRIGKMVLTGENRIVLGGGVSVLRDHYRSYVVLPGVEPGSP